MSSARCSALEWENGGESGESCGTELALPHYYSRSKSRMIGDRIGLAGIVKRMLLMILEYVSTL